MSRPPRFPGYKKCLALMRKHDPHLQEEGFHALLPHVAEHVDALIRDFRVEADRGLRAWLLELIAEAKSPKAFDLLVDQLRLSDDLLRPHAIHGLQLLDTHEARKVLFEAGVSTR